MLDVIIRTCVRVTYGVIVWPFCEWLPCLVIEAGYFRWVVGEVVDSAGGKMHPSVRDAPQNNLVWDIQVDDEAHGRSLSSVEVAMSGLFLAVAERVYA